GTRRSSWGGPLRVARRQCPLACRVVRRSHGGPRRAPQAPQRSERLGVAAALLGHARGCVADTSRPEPQIPEPHMKVSALAGGTGAAKLLRGLASCLAPEDLTVIGNTGDDTEVWRLHVSPDLDSVMYALAGVLDRERGWGRVNETFHCRDAMAAFGAETWFNLGDRDLATHLTRTAALRAGRSLSDVTHELTRRLGIAGLLLPMSDDPVRTRVRTPEAWLTFQEFFVRERARVKVLDVLYEGAEQARPAPRVLAAIADAELIIVCPSNPITSIGPILAVPGIREALARARARVVAVSPIVGDAAVSGPAG